MQIYAVKVQGMTDSSVFDALLSKVSLEKQSRIKKFRKVEDAMRTLIADILVRKVILNDGRLKNAEIVFVSNEFGKPSLKNADQFHFNCSHSGDWVVCIIDDKPVGIDIEKIQPIDLAIAKNVFSDAEYNALLDKEEDQTLLYFYDLWTLKEAFIKAVGKGLSIPLDSFTIAVDDNIIIDTKIKCGSYYFKQYNIDCDYKLSVCAQTDRFPDKVVIENMDELCREFLKYVGCDD